MNTATQSATVDRPAEIDRKVRGFKNILVPIDFSPSSKAALQYATAYMAQFRGWITLLAVIPKSLNAYEYGELEAISLREERMKQWQHALKQIAINSFGDVSHRELVRIGRPFEEIVLAAKDLKADLLIISRHSHNGNMQTELGSTAERVIRYATCPVLVVQPAVENGTSLGDLDVP